jgi:hypothetical protein
VLMQFQFIFSPEVHVSEQRNGRRITEAVSSLSASSSVAWVEPVSPFRPQSPRMCSFMSNSFVT